MRTTLLAVLVVAAISVASSEANAQCSGCSMPYVGSNYDAYNAGLNDYYCYYYGGSYCDLARQYASAAGVQVYAPAGASCANAAIYNYLCRYYEYYGYGWDYYGYCSYALQEAQAYSCCPCTNSKAPEVHRLYVMRDPYTGDSGVSTCDQGRYGRYTSPLFWVDLYRGLQNAELGTAGYSGYALYQCVRYDGWGRADEYMTTDPNCYVNGIYGSRVDWSTTAGYTLAAAYEGSANVPLYLCQINTGDQYGGVWGELTVLPNGCSGGIQLAFLGYARGQPWQSGQQEGTLKSSYDQCVENSGCFGECGPNCDGLLGTHYTTDGCLAHDRCVCRNGGNIWSINCLGDALYAGITLVAAIAVSIIKTIVGAIVSVVKAVLHFLCFWC
jgi:hypothetical protein